MSASETLLDSSKEELQGSYYLEEKILKYDHTASKSASMNRPGIGGLSEWSYISSTS